jgi:hypothetical protein
MMGKGLLGEAKVVTVVVSVGSRCSVPFVLNNEVE